VGDAARRGAFKNRLDENREDGANGDDAGRPSELVGLAALFLFQVEQHDDEEKQHHDRAGIDEHLHRRKEEGVQQHEQSGHRNDGQHQKHRAGDRVAAEGFATTRKPQSSVSAAKI